MPSYYKFKLIYHNFGHLKLKIFLGGLRIVKWVESNWRPYKSPICHKLIGKLATFTRSPMFHMGHDRLETHLQSVGSPICRVSDLLGIRKKGFQLFQNLELLKYLFQQSVQNHWKMKYCDGSLFCHKNRFNFL